MTISLTPRRTAVVIIAALAFIVAYLLGTSHGGGYVASAATSVPTATGSGSGGTAGITVSGLGKVTGKPDTLVLDLGVDANGSTVTAALAVANAAEAKVAKALKAGGVAEADLQSSGLSIQPNSCNPFAKAAMRACHSGSLAD